MAIHSPRAAAIPALRARLGPPLTAWRRTRTRLSAPAKASTRSAVPSVEASSITMASQSVTVWLRTLSMARAICAVALNAAIMTDTRTLRDLLGYFAQYVS